MRQTQYIVHWHTLKKNKWQKHLHESGATFSCSFRIVLASACLLVKYFCDFHLVPISLEDIFDLYSKWDRHNILKWHAAMRNKQQNNIYKLMQSGFKQLRHTGSRQENRRLSNLWVEVNLLDTILMEDWISLTYTTSEENTLYCTGTLVCSHEKQATKLYWNAMTNTVSLNFVMLLAGKKNVEMPLCES